MEWRPVGGGRTDAEVRLSADGRSHAKTARGLRSRIELAAERDRVLWLAEIGIPGPRLLDWREDEDGATLFTSTVPGVPAARLDGAGAVVVAPRLAAALADLHSIDVDDCPFERTLDVTMTVAERHVRRGLVDEGDFDPERRGRDVDDVWTEALKTRPGSEDLVVCHGDATLTNVLVDPDRLTVTGWVDLGRLGLADRHQDLALMTRSMDAPGGHPGFGPDHAAALLAAYPFPVDAARLAFYRLLDEFF